MPADEVRKRKAEGRPDLAANAVEMDTAGLRWNGSKSNSTYVCKCGCQFTGAAVLIVYHLCGVKGKQHGYVHLRRGAGGF